MKIKMDKNLLESLLSLATVIEARDAYTGGHTWRVSQYARLLATKLGLSAGEVFAALVGGLVHDIGKVGVPDAILNKKGKLDDNEYTRMKKHPEVGEQILANHPLRPLVYASVVEHHEREDNRGYPKANSDHRLSIIGRITSIADAFDAMTSTRSYRKGMAPAKAYAIINENLGSQFDRKAGEIFLQMGAAGELDHILGHCADETLMVSCPGCGPIIAPETHLHDGEHLVCPCCTGNFTAHEKGESFELEWEGTSTNLYVPIPDKQTVTGVLKQAPAKVSL